MPAEEIDLPMTPYTYTGKLMPRNLAIDPVIRMDREDVEEYQNMQALLKTGHLSLNDDDVRGWHCVLRSYFFLTPEVLESMTPVPTAQDRVKYGWYNVLKPWSIIPPPPCTSKVVFYPASTQLTPKETLSSNEESSGYSSAGMEEESASSPTLSLPAILEEKDESERTSITTSTEQVPILKEKEENESHNTTSAEQAPRPAVPEMTPGKLATLGLSSLVGTMVDTEEPADTDSLIESKPKTTTATSLKMRMKRAFLSLFGCCLKPRAKN